jgi:CD109 antigen
MINFVPNIVVLDYLTSSNKLTPEIESKAKSHMETGYQRELSYKHNDGSYSAFGGSDSKGSTWLTAFVLKSFNQASKYIKIEKSIIDQGFDFLTKVQNEDGSFPEVGKILAKSMQGGASKGIGLTAYVLTTFLEDQNTEARQNTINKGLTYIANNIESINDTYSLAIAAYAFQLANNPQFKDTKKALLEKLDSKSENSNQMKNWKRDESIESTKPDSISIEITSYALQAFIASGRDVEAFGIGKWLVTQRNENGGFQSTQDTVVGLQALAKLASTVPSTGNNIKINLNSENKNLIINVNRGNSLVLQKLEIPANSRHFDITANGQGISLLQISHRYNIDDSLKKPQFTIVPRVGEASNSEYLHLSVCTKFVADSWSDKSNMAIMEVTLPSGFTFDTDHAKELKSTPKIKVN